MRILIATVQVPYTIGGAELHAQSLRRQLQQQGHEAEIITFPFKFTPENYISDLMSFIANIQFDHFGWVSVDKLIALRFPAYYVNHQDKVVWLLHQHRAVYDLYDKTAADQQLQQLRAKIHQFDTDILGACPHLYANSRNVAQRLLHFNQIQAEPLYHPPHGEEHFYSAEALPYIYLPSRIETLKRQDLVIEAMRFVTSDIKLLLSGQGGAEDHCRELVSRYGLHDRVAFLGQVTEAQKYAFYAHSTAVGYPPYDEDYGYVTLEAMLAAKPVVTCSDSGGPLEFVIHGETGYVCDPDPRMLADTFDQLRHQCRRTQQLGVNGRQVYQDKNITWENVVNTLLYNR